MTTLRFHTSTSFLAGFVVAVMLMLGFRAITAAATDSNESTFVPVTPCRLFDTRSGAFNVGPRDAPIGEDASVAFQVTGTNGNCTVPAAATAVSINLTGVSPTAATNLRLYPADADVPNASVLNMTAGQAPTPNKLDVKLSPAGKIAIYNRFGTVDVVGDVMGYYRRDGVADLEARIAELEELTASMSVSTLDGTPTVRFTGVDVQVVSGSGKTDGAANGTGNLVVGYNENPDQRERTGSHNLVIGTRHSYTSFGGVVVGRENTSSGPFGSVFNGQENIASGAFGTVIGGESNEAGGARTSVFGGIYNSATGDYAAVLGGSDNLASGEHGSVCGGYFNTASGDNASVSGGEWGEASGAAASVSGGSSNVASGAAASVSGGSSNVASGAAASVSGGSSNVASGAAASVSGGDSRSTPGPNDWAAGNLFQDD